MEMLSSIAWFCSLCWYSTGRDLSHLLPVPETRLTLCLQGLLCNLCNMPAPAAHSQSPTWGSLSARSPVTCPSFCLALPAQVKLAECHLTIKNNREEGDGRHSIGHLKWAQHWLLSNPWCEVGYRFPYSFPLCLPHLWRHKMFDREEPKRLICHMLPKSYSWEHQRSQDINNSSAK